MRLFSSITFALMALVLPMAGVQMQFCTVLMAFVDGADGCPAQEKDCCGKKDCSKPTDCMIPAKLLPNADTSSQAKVPALPDSWVAVPVPAAFEEMKFFPTEISRESLRDPPDPPRLFLLQRRLLI